jgi:uncharacterized membrane protein
VPLDLPRGGLRACLIAVCVAGLALVVAAPWAAHRGWWVSSLLYALFDPVCHQIPERSFHLAGAPLAVCHRCSGLYLGFALGIASWPRFPAAAAHLLAQPRWIVAFAVPLAADALFVANSQGSRFGTGLLAAFPVALLALAAASQLAASSTTVLRRRAETPLPAGASGAAGPLRLQPRGTAPGGPP